MITFDGLYSLVSLGLALFAIIVTNFINKSDFDNYPFGKAMLEPILVIIKSLVLFIICIINIFSSMQEVLKGGKDVSAGFALGYALISSIGCTVVYLYMRKTSKNLNSDIVKVESSQWLMDSILSVGVLVGFIVSILLKFIGLGNLSNYVDPGMVILCATVFLKMPISAISEAFKEITNSKADDEISCDIDELIKEIQEEYKLEDYIARVAKVGRELRIEIDFIVSKDSTIKSIEDMDKVREIIDKNTNHFDLNKWMNISFTKNKKWAI